MGEGKVRVLAISDEVDEGLNNGSIAEMDVDLVVSCGDLPWDYLEYLVTIANVPLAYVPGNHDPDPKPEPPENPLRPGYLNLEVDPPLLGPGGGTPLDGKVLDHAGLRLAGLGGSLRYSGGPHQYTEAQMRRRALKLEARARARRMRDGRGIDLLVSHIPPLGAGDRDDPAHRGSKSLWRLIKVLRPKVLVHGHIHPHGEATPDRVVEGTSIVNAVGHRILEIEP